jgi:hypothetical protein
MKQNKLMFPKIVSKSRKHKKQQKLPKLPKIKSLEAKLKRLLYPLIKKRDGPICISCGKRGLKGNDWQAGHYIKAELCNIEWRYNPLNIHSQCSYCNKWLRGNTIAYRNALIKKIGLIEVEMIDRSYKLSMPMDFNERKYLMELIEKYGHLEKIER